jgi:hypothetical protein
MAGISQRTFWNGPPESLRELFTATNTRGSRARCVLWSHPFGWELRLDVNGSLIRLQVMRSLDDLTTTADEWKQAMTENDWTPA